jgi:hypothetical protein
MTAIDRHQNHKLIQGHPQETIMLAYLYLA